MQGVGAASVADALQHALAEVKATFDHVYPGLSPGLTFVTQQPPPLRRTHSYLQIMKVANNER